MTIASKLRWLAGSLAFVLAGQAVARPEATIDARGFAAIGRSSSPAGDDVATDVWRMRRTGSADHDFDLVAVVLPPSRNAMTVVPMLRADFAPVLFRVDLCRDAAVVTNGGFFIRTGTRTRPLGLVRSGGRTLSRASGRRYGGFVVATGGWLSVLRRDAVATARTADEGIESSPVIVWAGRSDMKSDDGIRFDRTAIGTTTDGRAVVVGAFGTNQDTVSLAELGTLAMAAVRTRGARLATLLALDGGPSAHLYLPARRRLFGFAGSIFLPNAICLSRR